MLCFVNYLVREWARENHQNSSYQTTLLGQSSRDIINASETALKLWLLSSKAHLCGNNIYCYHAFRGYVIVRHIGNVEFYNRHKFHHVKSRCAFAREDSRLVVQWEHYSAHWQHGKCQLWANCFLPGLHDFRNIYSPLTAVASVLTPRPWPFHK